MKKAPLHAVMLERVLIDLGECGDLVWGHSAPSADHCLASGVPPPHVRGERRHVFKSLHDLPKDFLPCWKHNLCLVDVMVMSALRSVLLMS